MALAAWGCIKTAPTLPMCTRWSATTRSSPISRCMRARVCVCVCVANVCLCGSLSEMRDGNLACSSFLVSHAPPPLFSSLASFPASQDMTGDNVLAPYNFPLQVFFFSPPRRHFVCCVCCEGGAVVGQMTTPPHRMGCPIFWIYHRWIKQETTPVYFVLGCMHRGTNQ